MALGSLDPRTRHAEWQQRKAIADAQAATDAANRSALVAAEDQALAAPQRWEDPDIGRQVNAGAPGLDGMYEAAAAGGPVDDAGVAPVTQLAREDIADEERRAMENLGMGVAGQTLGRAGSLGGDVNSLAQALTAQRVTSRRNRLYGATNEFIAATRAGQQRQHAAERQYFEAEQAAAESEAAYYIDEHARISGEAQAQADVEQVRQERMSAELEAQQVAVDEIRKAADAFVNAPPVDPQRFWKDRTGFQRFSGVLAAAAFGAAGWSPDQVTAHIRQAADADIDAQKFNSDLAQRKFGARVAAFEAGQSMWQQLRQKFADDEMAAHAMRAARFEEAKAKLTTIRANNGLPLQDAVHQQQIAAIDQEIAKETLQLKTMQVKNLPRFVSVKPALSGPQRQVGMMLLKDALGRRGKLEELGLQQAGSAAETQMKVQGDIDKERVKSAGGGPISEGDSKLLMAHYDNTQAAGTISDAIDDFLRDYGARDIPGRGASRIVDWASPNDVADAEVRLSLIEDSIGRMQSGGAITEDEANRFRGWIRAGVGDEQLLANLRNIQAVTHKKLQRSERALPTRLRAHYRRLYEEMTPELDADVTGATGRVNRPGGEGGVVSVDR